MLDQPAGLLLRLGYLLDVYNAHRAYRQALYSYPGDKISGWEQQNADTMELLQHVRRMRRRDGGGNG